MSAESEECNLVFSTVMADGLIKMHLRRDRGDAVYMLYQYCMYRPL